MVKLQTLDADGNVLEQAAFSELQLDAPVRIDKLNQMMARARRLARRKGRRGQDHRSGRRLAAEGGRRRLQADQLLQAAGVASPAAEGTLQWIFSDGLAAVSLFVEPYDRQRHVQEGLFSSGATQTLTRRVQDWWLTAVGEVPPQTLKAFAQSLERRK